jgi:hypothetical protein
MKKTLINELQDYIDLSDFGCMNIVYADILQNMQATADIYFQQAIIYEKCGNVEKSQQLFNKYKELTNKKKEN